MWEIWVTLQSFYSTDITRQPSRTTRTLLLRSVLNAPTSSDHPEVEVIDIDTLGLKSDLESDLELGPISSQATD
jgi:hypothetical protein